MLSGESPSGWTIGSIHTSPVNQSAGPLIVDGFGCTPMSHLLCIDPGLALLPRDSVYPAPGRIPTRSRGRRDASCAVQRTDGCREERSVSDVVVVIGPGAIGQAIARRVGAGKQVVLADLRQANADAAAESMRNAGFDVSTTTVDVSSRQSVHSLVETAAAIGDITRLVHAAG